MGLLDLLFGDKNQLIKDALAKGGAVIDVRTPEEFKFGCVPGSINIPLDQINSKLSKVKKLRQPLVLCCASGSRSGTAKMILKSKGIKDVINGGSWNKVNNIKSEMK